MAPTTGSSFFLKKFIKINPMEEALPRKHLLAYGTGTKWFKGRNDPSDGIVEQLVEQIVEALRAGFTHIDTAEIYGTEPEVGLALQRFFQESGKTRADVFITTKVSAPPANVHKSITDSLARLGPAAEGYVDLYLIHSPFWEYSQEGDLSLAKVWADMESLVTTTKQARRIGVSNWRIEDFEALAKVQKIPPFANQVEQHAYLQNKALVTYHKSHSIQTCCYGPLQPIIKFANDGPVKAIVERIAAEKGVTAAQVLLAWGIADGNWLVTTSANPTRLRESLAALDVTLSDAERLEIQISGEAVELRKFWTKNF